MPNTLKNLFPLIVLLLFTLHAKAQPDFRFNHFTIKDGLSQSQAFTLFQDSYGYLWIGTQDGLNRFDGNAFKVYKNDPFDSTTLTHNWVWTVQEDERGDIWVGTFQGLCRYIRKEDRFVQYYHNPKDSTSISGNRPNYILKDRKGRLWISSWGGGLNLYDPDTDSFKQFRFNPDDNSSISDNAVRTLFCDSDGAIWVGTWNGGLNKVIEDKKGISFLRYNSKAEFGSDGGKRITTIAEDSEKNLWIGSYGAGLLTLDRSRRLFSRIPGFSENDINKIIRDSQGNMWVGTNSGLRVYDSQTESFRYYQHDPADPGSISSNTIYAITEDRSGIVWIAGNGLDQFDPRKSFFETYRNNPNDPTSLGQNMVWSFCEDDEGFIWVGTESGPLNVFDPASKTFKRINVHDDRGNIAENIHQIACKQGVLWLGSFKSGLIRYEKRTGKTKFFLNNHPSILGKVALISEVLMDDDETLWIGTNENGLIHYNPKNDSVTNYVYRPNDPESIGSNFLNSLYKDSKGNIWIGFWGGGMSMLNKRTGKFVNYRYDRKNKDGLSDQVVVSICQQNDSIFWICTNSGLNRLNVNTGHFKHFFEKDGLTNNVVYDMLQDSRGNYWISSDRGLNKFYTLSVRFKNFTDEDGLQSNEFNANAAMKSSTGDLYFGGVNGFNVFNPDNMRENTTPPLLVIESYKVHDKIFTTAAPVINLNHDENYLSFSYSALEFSSPGKIRYAYMLEGFDNEWNEVGGKREAQYTNLDPGHYVFRVKAANPDGHWTVPGEAINIVIYPPFWNTWWFTTLVIALIGAMVYMLHRYRLAQSLKVERLRNKIASDLHDEVGSSLTRISIYSDLLQNETMREENKGYLKNINVLSREVVSTMSDIVWSIDNRSDTMGAIILRMKDLATEVLQAKNIELDFKVNNVPDHTTLDPAQKQNLYLIFKESINNIVKHAGATQVMVSLNNEGGEFSMIIKDNGKGFKHNGQAKGNGLRNMQRRAQAIGGTFQARNEAGTTITFQRKAF